MSEQDPSEGSESGADAPASVSGSDDATPPASAPAAPSQPPPSQSNPAAGGEAPAEDPVAAAKAEAAKYREQLLRTAADFDNYRKRSRREQEDALRKGKESTLKELLPVFDNLERAITSSASAPDIKSVADGLRLVQRQFVQTLDRLNVKRVETVGLPFDPAKHEAIQHVESAEHPAGVVAVEVQSGYSIGDFLVRAALVAVSKGPPEGAEPQPGSGEEPAEAEAPAEGGDGGAEAS